MWTGLSRLNGIYRVLLTCRLGGEEVSKVPGLGLWRNVLSTDGTRAWWSEGYAKGRRRKRVRRVTVFALLSPVKEVWVERELRG